MRFRFALGSLLLIGCGSSTPAPVEPTAPTPATLEPKDPEAAASDSEESTPEGDAAPPETPSAPAKDDRCQHARARIAECTKNDSLANATAAECKNELASAPIAVEQLTRCLDELGCKALAKSSSTADGAVGICFIAAKRKLLDPDAP